MRLLHNQAGSENRQKEAPRSVLWDLFMGDVASLIPFPSAPGQTHHARPEPWRDSPECSMPAEALGYMAGAIADINAAAGAY